MIPHIMGDTRNRETFLIVTVRNGTETKLWNGILIRKGFHESFFIVVLIDVEVYVPARKAAPATVPAILVILLQE